MSSKGDLARESILNRATAIASVEGLRGLTLGTLAKDLGRSKSGLFSHFANKEALQLEVLEAARAAFNDTVIKPTLKQSRGLPRLKALMSNWGAWARAESRLPGGCIFVSASTELDDKPGPVRDRLVELQREWLEGLGRVIATGVAEGHFRGDLDVSQMAFEIYSTMLGSHHYARLLNDKDVEARCRIGFRRILEDAQVRT